MSVHIVFEAHSTSVDNGAKLASGWRDVDLSPLGIRQSQELGDRRKGDGFAAVLCSDLKRSFYTGKIAFAGTKIPVLRDRRLRECNYGDLNGAPSAVVDAEKPLRIETPFPNGQSYVQTTALVKDFLHDIGGHYDGQKVLIIGSRATQYGLENIINGVPLATLVAQKFVWRPGWEYIWGNGR